MSLKSRLLALGCVLVLTLAAGAAQAQYALTSGSGGEQQIGTGLPLPVGPAGIFLGGMVKATAGTPFWPPLLVPPAPAPANGGIVQTPGGKLMIPPGVLAKAAPGTPAPIAVFPTNPAVFQVATPISYAWPAGPATLSAGGAPGIVGPPVVTFMTGGGGKITYNGGTAAFGGPGQFAIAAGPGAAGGRVPPNGTGMLPVASVWINACGKLPGSGTMAGIVGASAPLGIAQPGAPVAALPATTMFGPVVKGIGFMNLTAALPPFCLPCCTVGPAGTISSSISVTAGFPSNMVTASKGYPWSTGLVTVSHTGAVPTEIFYLAGADTRVAGSGVVSLVSGSLSLRALSGPNANRGWLRLPEPGAGLAAAGALGMLGLCHMAVRRRSR